MTDHLTVGDSVNSANHRRASAQYGLSDAAKRKFSGSLMGSGAMAMGLTTPKGLSSPIDFESMPAFTVSAMKGIPDKNLIRTNDTSRNRMGSLMRVPTHKTGTHKFDREKDARSIAPLTSEDIG